MTVTVANTTHKLGHAAAEIVQALKGEWYDVSKASLRLELCD